MCVYIHVYIYFLFQSNPNGTSPPDCLSACSISVCDGSFSPVVHCFVVFALDLGIS